MLNLNKHFAQNTGSFKLFKQHNTHKNLLIKKKKLQKKKAFLSLRHYPNYAIMYCNLLPTSPPVICHDLLNLSV